jgi:hypothetical protein
MLDLAAALLHELWLLAIALDSVIAWLAEWL